MSPCLTMHICTRELRRIVPSSAATRNLQFILGSEPDAKCKVKRFDVLNPTQGQNAKILKSEPLLLCIYSTHEMDGFGFSGKTSFSPLFISEEKEWPDLPA